jgi:ABC-type lipoprotein export system ATPase subunit
MSGVDGATGKEIVREFKKLVKSTNKKVLWVTHNQTEAKQLGKVIKVK